MQKGWSLSSVIWGGGVFFWALDFLWRNASHVRAWGGVSSMWWWVVAGCRKRSSHLPHSLHYSWTFGRTWFMSCLICSEVSCVPGDLKVCLPYTPLCHGNRTNAACLAIVHSHPLLRSVRQNSIQKKVWFGSPRVDLRNWVGTISGRWAWVCPDWFLDATWGRKARIRVLTYLAIVEQAGFQIAGIPFTRLCMESGWFRALR